MYDRNAEINVLFNRHAKHNSVVAVIVVLIFLMLPIMFSFTADVSYAAPEDESDPEISAAAAILIEAETGQILFEKDVDAQRAPASTTKIMTALLAIESLAPDQMVTIDSDVEAVGESQIYLTEGEEISVEDLLYATLITSANDAAVALAKAVSGTEADFVVKMNERAAQLGLDGTHFVNANGLHDENHYSTARDMATLGIEAMKNDVFRRYVSAAEYTIPATNQSGERYMDNSNQMLFDTDSSVEVNGESRPIKYDGTVGIKTGFHDAAGRCLVSMVERNDISLVAVVLGSEAYTTNVFRDSIVLFEYGFNNFEPIPVFGDDNSQIDVPVIKGKPKNVAAGPAKELAMLVPKNLPGNIRYDFEVADNVEAPIAKGETVGKIRAYSDDTLLGEVDLVSLADVKRRFSLLSLFGGDKKEEPAEDVSEDSSEDPVAEPDEELADEPPVESDEPKDNVEKSSSSPISVVIKVVVAIIILVVGFFVYIIIKHNKEVLARRRRRRMKWGSSFNTREIKRVKRLK